MHNTRVCEYLMNEVNHPFDDVITQNNTHRKSAELLYV